MRGEDSSSGGGRGKGPPPEPVEDKRLERRLRCVASPERREETPVGVRRNAPHAARATHVVPDVEEREEPRRQRCAEVEASVSAYPSRQPGRYPCEQCTKVYSYKADLMRHEKDHENAVYSCEKCGKYSSKSEKNLVEHMRHCGVGGLYVYAVRATERVPTGSCHFPCSTDPSQSVVSFPCVRK